MKCPICGSISGNDKFCGVCGTRLDQVSQVSPNRTAQTIPADSSLTVAKLVFWLALIPIGWTIFNLDFSSMLESLNLPYVIAFNFAGLPLMLLGGVMGTLTVWDSATSLIPLGCYRRAQGAREGWKRLGTPTRFLIVSSLGELAILGAGWTIGIALGIDYHATLAIVLGVLLLFGLGLYQGRTSRYYPRGQRYDRYLRQQANKISRPKGRWLLPAVYLAWTSVTLAFILLA